MKIRHSILILLTLVCLGFGQGGLDAWAGTSAKNYCSSIYTDKCTLFPSVSSSHSASSLPACSDVNNFTTGRDQFIDLQLDTEFQNFIIRPGTTIPVSALMELDCSSASDLKANLVITNQKGSTFLFPLTLSNQDPIDETSRPITDYCWLEQCEFDTYSSNINIPYALASGPWTLNVSIQNTFTKQSKTYTYKNALLNSPNYVKPTPVLGVYPKALVSNPDKVAMCYSLDFTSDAISSYGIESIKWKADRIQTSLVKGKPVSKTTPIETVVWPIGLQGGNATILQRTKFSAMTTTILEDGSLSYGYIPIAQKKGDTLKCTMSVVATSGNFQVKSVQVKMTRTINVAQAWWHQKG